MNIIVVFFIVIFMDQLIFLVMERKATRFEQELVSSREDGLHMLLRLKQMMDFKITEAEMKSMNQQRKINELEAQLNEAEDIVGDLRAELRQVHGALEKMKLNQSRLKEQNQNDNKLNTSTNSVREGEKREETDIKSVCDPDNWHRVLKDLNEFKEVNHVDKKQKLENNLSPNYLRNQDMGMGQEVKWVSKDSSCKLEISDGRKGSPIEVSDMDVCCLLEKEPDELKPMKLEVKNLNGLEPLSSFCDNEAMEICEAPNISPSKTLSCQVNNKGNFKEKPHHLNDENKPPKDQESRFSSISPSPEMDINLVCVEQNNKNGVLDQPANDRPNKLGRKTKREPLSSIDVSSSFVDNYGSLNSEKSILNNKSSRASERLAQVARQKSDKVASSFHKF